ncbi:hypothetical protein [Carboxylicivirga sp. N1Y90]|uniref:hypothetical protein n=1 Tax=Carboxylicivirga fragile TaxID=3417571 RepID=UPI003D33E1D1|nr:hypothetical protein [Marinilabiliaceae bacterium N1Y90]
MVNKFYCWFDIITLLLLYIGLLGIGTKAKSSIGRIIYGSSTSFFITAQSIALYYIHSFIGYRFYLFCRYRSQYVLNIEEVMAMMMFFIALSLLSIYLIKAIKLYIVRLKKIDRSFKFIAVITYAVLISCSSLINESYSFISFLHSKYTTYAWEPVISQDPKNTSVNNWTKYINDKTRFIAHAGGEINNFKYTNSKEALDLSYHKGFRMFELDIITTSDGEYVAAHDWKHWSNISNYQGHLPVNHYQFMSKKLHNQYTPLDMASINEWFMEHKDAVLVTDMLNDPINFAKLFIDKERLIMELFDEQTLMEAVDVGILSAMAAEQVIYNYSTEDVKMLKQKGVNDIAISLRFAKRNESLLRVFLESGIKPYVYHMNSIPGFSEEYILKNEMNHIYGIYADKWTFN